jgi:hypothetical protein
VLEGVFRRINVNVAKLSNKLLLIYGVAPAAFGFSQLFDHPESVISRIQRVKCDLPAQFAGMNVEKQTSLGRCTEN